MVIGQVGDAVDAEIGEDADSGQDADDASGVNVGVPIENIAASPSQSLKMMTKKAPMAGLAVLCIRGGVHPEVVGEGVQGRTGNTDQLRESFS